MKTPLPVFSLAAFAASRIRRAGSLARSAARRDATPLRLLRGLTLLFGLLAPTILFAAFGYTDTGSAYLVDSGAGLVFRVRKSDGTVDSIVFNGVEYNGGSNKGSHIASGLGSTGTTVTP
jgi:rhamnogalacturonan endolyase